MNIIQLMQDSYLPDLSGNAIALECFRKAIARRHRNVVFIWNKDHREEFEKVGDVPVYNPQGNRDVIEERLLKTIKEESIDLLIAHSYREEGRMSVLEKAEIPKVLIAHYDYGEKMREIQDIFQLIISFQKPQIEDYIDLGVPEDKLLFCPPPRDLSVFRPLDIEKERSILYVGRLIEAKGIHKILPHLDYLSADLICVGPRGKDKSYEEKLERIAQEEIEQRVDFKGKISKEELIEEYNRASAFLLLSSSDCYSLVLQEAILTGLPAVALENYGHYDWTEGHIFIENSVEMCVHRLKQILDGNCRLKYDDEFARALSLEKNAPRLNQRLEEIVEEPDQFQWEERW